MKIYNLLLARTKAWKSKAKERRLNNKALKKRIKELTHSRDVWKNKYQKEQRTNEELKKNEKNQESKNINTVS